MNDVNLNPETQTDVSKLEVLISRQQLQERIRELGQKISADYKKQHGPFNNKKEAEAIAKSLIQKNIDDFYHLRLQF